MYTIYCNETATICTDDNIRFDVSTDIGIVVMRAYGKSKIKKIIRESKNE